MKPWRSDPVNGARRGPLGRGSLVRGGRGAWAEWWANRAFTTPMAVLIMATLCGFAGCFPPEHERLSCSDVYPPGSFDYRVLENLIRQDEVGTSKGCLGAPCHSAGTQNAGIRLDTSKLIYDELSTRPDTFYEVLASGYMPDEGIPWDEEDLKVFRSWYCAGAFPP
jgi:hypothetical protein